jgi:hypothetical protein
LFVLFLQNKKKIKLNVQLNKPNNVWTIFWEAGPFSRVFIITEKFYKFLSKFYEWITKNV